MKSKCLNLSKLFLFVVVCIFSSNITSAQLIPNDANSMYYKKDFYSTNYSKTITFATAKTYTGTMQAMQADIYYPGTVADNANTKRPVLVLYHGGGFLAGTRNNDINKNFMNYFTRKGFIVITASYRLGWPKKGGVTDLFLVCGSTKMNDFDDALYRAFQDSRNLIKYLNINADNLKIDANNIFVMGYSAGAILTLNFLGDDPLMLNADRKNRLGGILSDDLSTNVAGLISIAGSYSRDDISYRNIPTAFFHGTCDIAVPYSYGSMVMCPNFSKSYGPDVLHKKLNQQNIYNEVHTFCGYEHEFYSKEDSDLKNPKAFQYFQQSVGDFMYGVMSKKYTNSSNSKFITVTDLPSFPYKSKMPACKETSKYSACNGGTNTTPTNNNTSTNTNTTPTSTTTADVPFNINLALRAINLNEALSFYISSPKQETLTIDIFNIVGNNIASTTISVNAGESQYNLQNNLLQGTYLITISNKEKVLYTDYISIRKPL